MIMCVLHPAAAASSSQLTHSLSACLPHPLPSPCLPRPLQVGAPLRPVTVRDAIGDLPEIASGHAEEEMEYTSAPVSAWEERKERKKIETLSAASVSVRRAAGGLWVGPGVTPSRCPPPPFCHPPTPVSPSPLPPSPHSTPLQVSAFQQHVRGDCSLLTEHISKQMNELNLERCRCIPKNCPGADWRVLEEIVKADPAREKFKVGPRCAGWRGSDGG